jgi:hypothetical protein
MGTLFSSQQARREKEVIKDTTENFKIFKSVKINSKIKYDKNTGFLPTF